MRSDQDDFQEHSIGNDTRIQIRFQKIQTAVAKGRVLAFWQMLAACMFNKILPLDPLEWYSTSLMPALLIMSCSATKSSKPGLLPALDRYDGPHFRVLRRQLRGQHIPERTLILSARFGLIDSHTPIPTYDQKLTEARVIQLRHQVMKNFEQLTKGTIFDRIFVFGSRLYWSLLSDAVETAGKRVQVRVASGRPGERLAELKSWLIGLGQR